MFLESKQDKILSLILIIVYGGLFECVSSIQELLLPRFRKVESCAMCGISSILYSMYSPFKKGGLNLNVSLAVLF